MAKELRNKVHEAVRVILQPVRREYFPFFTFYNKLLPKKSNLSFLYSDYGDNFPGVVTPLEKNSINQKNMLLKRGMIAYTI